MQNIFKPSLIQSDNSEIFLTDSTFLHFPYFRFDNQKQIACKYIKKIMKEFKISLLDCSISMNHYHLRFYLKNGKDLGKIKQLLRGGISHEYRKEFKCPYKEIWQSHKILQIYSDDMSIKVSGYIAGNLLKHKEVSTFEELKNNPYSSYWHLVKRLGDEIARQVVCGVIDVKENEWGVLDLNGLSKIKNLR